MWLHALRAEGWRNLAPLHLTFDEGDAALAVFHGDNGQGKTNLLEVLYYIATLRSFRTREESALVQHGAPMARIGAVVRQRDLNREVDVRLTPPGRAVTLDGKPVRRLAAYLGTVSVVLFVPEDLLLPRAAPAARRRFIDLAIFGVERAYWTEASDFQKVLRSRNALLRQGGFPPALLETYDEQLARAGSRVIMRRRAAAAELGPRMRQYFRELHADIEVALVYRSHAEVPADGSEEDVRAALLEGLRRRAAVDGRRRHTTFGPQSDDLALMFNGHLAAENASQGQLRSLVLALKLAELSHREARLDDSPILLLDDVPSELDAERRRYLFDTLERLSCQTLISVADPNVVPARARRVDFQVRAGQVARS